MPPVPDGPEVTRDDIAAGLQRLGLSAGAGVMVHSSLKSFGRVVARPGETSVASAARTVVEALMDVLTPAGTLMMPSFNHGAAYAADGPGYFDPTATATTNGAIPDCFWRMPGVYRSLHPTHSFAAWGRHARRYTRFHHRTLSCGPDSPLGLLGREGGYGLLLGVGYRSNTHHHVVEMSTGAPCLGRRTASYAVRLADGRMVEARAWGWREKGCPITDGRQYGPLMRACGLQAQEVIGACEAILFRLHDCFELIAELLRTGVGGFPPCSRCRIRPRRGPRTRPSDWDDQKQRLKPDSPAWEY